MSSKSTTVSTESTAADIPVGGVAMSAESAAIKVATVGITWVEVTTVGITWVEVTTVGVSTINVPTIYVSATIGISAAISIVATVVGALKAAHVEAAPNEKSGIPSFKKRPIVSIIVVIPVVTVPDGIVIISISFIRIRIGALICWVGLLIGRIRLLIGGGRGLINRRRCLVNAWRYILRIATGGYQHAGGCQDGECKDLFHFVCDFKLAVELFFRCALPGYKKVNRVVYLTGVC
jgi:hypothetical protein